MIGVIHRSREGEPLHYGLNWTRDERTHLELYVRWRTWRYGYTAGVRIRKRRYGSMVLWRRVMRWEVVA